MLQQGQGREYLLATFDGVDEQRWVSLLLGESLALVEQSAGAVTKIAYGAPSHGHKMMGSRASFARALEVHESALVSTLRQIFADPSQDTQLSHIMDLFDAKGEYYTYVAWTGLGDAVFRPAG